MADKAKGRKKLDLSKNQLPIKAFSSMSAVERRKARAEKAKPITNDSKVKNSRIRSSSKSKKK